MVRPRTILKSVSGLVGRLVCLNTNFKTSNLCLNDQAYNCLIHFRLGATLPNHIPACRSEFSWKSKYRYHFTRSGIFRYQTLTLVNFPKYKFWCPWNTHARFFSVFSNLKYFSAQFHQSEKLEIARTTTSKLQYHLLLFNFIDNV